MGCILGIFIYAGIAIKWLAIAGFYFFKYTLPIWIVALCFSMGTCIGSSCSGMKNDWVREQIRNNTHTLTIVWNELDGQYTTTVSVREDMHWSVNGYDSYNDELWSWEMGELDPSAILDGASYGKSGQKCIGFYEAPLGLGEIYATAGGIGLVKITQDTTIYAAWMK